MYPLSLSVCIKKLCLRFLFSSISTFALFVFVKLFDMMLVSLHVLCCVHTWGWRECSREKTAKNRRRVSAICCCTISLPMRRQMRAIRLRVLRQTAVRVCTPLGNLSTAEQRMNDTSIVACFQITLHFNTKMKNTLHLKLNEVCDK